MVRFIGLIEKSQIIIIKSNSYANKLILINEKRIVEYMAKNDNTLKTLGLIYQTYIALKMCLSMNYGDTIVIEKHGDITKLSNNSMSKQIEVKHHVKKNKISDRDSEIWNTVWNWYDSFSELKELNIQEFVLFTTSGLGDKSVFTNWSNMNSNERYNIFKGIGDKCNPKEGIFRKTYNKIFNSNHNQSKLKSVLNKFVILSEQDMIKTIIDENINTHFKLIPNKENIQMFINSLIGYLTTIPIKNNTWQITFEDFDKVFKEYGQKFVIKGKIPLPDEFRNYKVTKEDTKKASKKKFIAEIKKINLREQLLYAINDYCKTYMTIEKYFNDNIIKFSNLDSYQDELKDDLNFRRGKYERKCKSKKLEEQIVYSQDMYFDFLELPVRDFGNVYNNRGFFQRGMIHIIVDDGNLIWYLGDEK